MSEPTEVPPPDLDSKQSGFLGAAVPRLVTENHAVEDFDAEDAVGVGEAAGELAVFAAGLRIPRRIVVEVMWPNSLCGRSPVPLSEGRQ